MKTLNKFLKIARTVYTKELTLNEYFEALKIIEDAEPEIKAELKTKTVKILKSVNSQLGNFTDSRDKKGDLINKIYEELTGCFLFGRSISYFMGEETNQTAKAKLLTGTTAEALQNFYNDRAAAAEAKKKAVENPQTLEEFRTFCSERGKDQLTPEQHAQHEKLQADVTLKRQQQDQERQNTVNKIENENVEFTLHPTKHSKTGEDIYTVIMVNRVNPEEFKTLRAAAKKIGGYYSRFTNLRIEPQIKAGFNFDTEEEAQKFMDLKEQAQDTTEEAEARQEEKKQTAGERMTERANIMIKKAEESLNQDRRTNTHKQAGQAATAEGKARAEIIFAKKLIKIAEGFDNGSIKYLHALRNGKQLEQLETILRQGYNKRLTSEGLTYSQKEAEEPQPDKDVNFIEYPYPIFYMETIKQIFSKYADTKGMKLAVKRILSGYKNKPKSENDQIILKGEYTINLFKKTASKIPDKWEKDRILNQIKDYERIQNMGLTNESILKTALRELTALSAGTGTSAEDKAKAENTRLERTFIGKKIAGFFPTPQPLINRMFSMVKVFEGETVREPSAGLGHIAEQIKAKYPDNDLKVNEVNHSLCEVLENKGFNVSEHSNFLNETEKTDVIFMNPPFEKNQDIDHVNHAFSLLKESGRLVSVMAAKNENSSNKKIIKFFELIEEHGYIQKNEEGSFKSAFNSTGVNTIMVYLEKPRTTEEEPQKAEEIEVIDPETLEAAQEPENAMKCDNSNQQLTFF